MSWSTAEEARVAAIETILNSLQQAISNLMAKAQMKQLLLIKQAEIDSLTSRVATLERLLTIIQQHLE